MKKITTEVYREYLVNRLRDLREWAKFKPDTMEGAKLKLKAEEKIDFIMFQLYQIDSAEQEE